MVEISKRGALKTKETNSPPIEIDDRYATTSEEKAQAFNDFFVKQSELDDRGKEPDTS